MATGVPKTIRGVPRSDVVLSYQGKRSGEEVVAVPPARTVRVWSHPSRHSNRLYFGENLAVLSGLLRDGAVKGQVRLIYIDPPFSTQSSFYSRKQDHAYEDLLCGAEYVEFLRQRLILLRELLTSDGSIYLHLDDKMVFHMKVVMDEVFAPQNYRNCITRKKCNPKNYTRNAYGNVADYLLFYTKSQEYVWNKPLEPWTEDRAKEYQYVEAGTGRRFMKVPVHAPGIRRGETGKAWRGMLPPPGKHWQFPPATLDQMDARGEIFWSANGNPRRKIYLDENPGIGVQDIWLNFRDAHNQNIRITGYPTEKNPDLVRRIIEASSMPGDLVLDCFAGSGTTLAVADELGRRWIGIDNGLEAIQTTLHRLHSGTHAMGDFTQFRNGSRESEGVVVQPSLFSSLDTAQELRPHPREHKPVLEFEFLVAEDLLPQANRMVAEWCKLVSRYPEVMPERTRVTECRGWDPAIAHLSERDTILAKIIEELGGCRLAPQAGSFRYLVDAIIGQQLTQRAASAIVSRLRKISGSKTLTARRLLALDERSVHGAGISKRKCECLRALARSVLSKSLELSKLATLSDEDVMRKLTKLKGIGPWTAEMYLMFVLARPDVFPIHDRALRKTIVRLYGVAEESDSSIAEITERWRPFRSVACWYLYRYKNTRTVEGSS